MWFNHPKFKSAKKELVKQLDLFKSSNSNPASARRQYFGREPLPKIIFICGGDPLHCFNREKIEKYINKHSENLLTFRAEYAWDTIVSSDKKMNALSLEDWLAEFSDAVLILVESFGTAAELGAFAMSNSLRKKLLPILDKPFENHQSFINTGPVRWVNKESKFGPVLYIDFNSILTCMPEVIERVDVRRSKQYNHRNDSSGYGELNFSKKEMLFLIVLIIISVGPVTDEIVVDICKECFGIKNKSHIDDFSLMISLCVALQMISKFSHKERVFYYCSDYSVLKRNASTEPLIKLSQSMRSKCLSHLVYIDEYKYFFEVVKC